MHPPEVLRRLFAGAVKAVAPARVLRHRLPEPPAGRTLVVGAGKAAAAMARAVERFYPAPVSGIAITRYGHGARCNKVEVVEAAHPVPDAVGARASRRVLELVAHLERRDLVLCLLSGGGSALLAVPGPGTALDDKQAVTRQLLRCGAPIAAINCVRKHLSAVKGGRLAAACWPARVVTLAISDVPGDDPAVIASGPTVADPSSCAEAIAIAARHGLDLAPHVRRCLAENETPKADDPRLERSKLHVVASAGLAFAAATASATALGLTPVCLGHDLQGEARALAGEHAALAHRVMAGLVHCPRPCVLLSGGETTVAVRGPGRGGRNTEYALALALALEGLDRHKEVWAIACDTDGIDGTEDSAGAIIGPDTLARARALGLDPARLLEANDSHALFAALGDLVATGPTRTNVNDFRAILIQ